MADDQNGNNKKDLKQRILAMPKWQRIFFFACAVFTVIAAAGVSLSFVPALVPLEISGWFIIVGAIGAVATLIVYKVAGKKAKKQQAQEQQAAGGTAPAENPAPIAEIPAASETQKDAPAEKNVPSATETPTEYSTFQSFLDE